jgi:hypothetical protein
MWKSKQRTTLHNSRKGLFKRIFREFLPMHPFKSQKAAISLKQLPAFNQRSRSDRYAAPPHQEATGKRQDSPNSAGSCPRKTNGHQQGAFEQVENTCLPLQ